MPTPIGSVPALSAASATIFSIGIAFLGYWGMYEPTGWRVADIIVFVTRADRLWMPRARTVDGDEPRRAGNQRCQDTHCASSVSCRRHGNLARGGDLGDLLSRHPHDVKTRASYSAGARFIQAKQET